MKSVHLEQSVYLELNVMFMARIRLI